MLKLSEQYARIEEYSTKFSFGQLLNPKTSSTEGYQDTYGASRVEGVIFNSENKGAMAVLGKELMEDRRLLLPAHSDIRRDLRKLQKIVSIAGNVRFNAARDKDGHADRCWAMLLACNAAVNPTTPIEFRSTGQAYDDLVGYGHEVRGRTHYYPSRPAKETVEDYMKEMSRRLLAMSGIDNY